MRPPSYDPPRTALFVPGRRRITRASEAGAFFQKALAYQGDDCLLWPFSRSGPRYDKGPFSLHQGYGQMQIDGKRHTVHRLICMIVNGKPPPSRNDAAHTCGIPACVNPRHLRWASRKENQADRLTHGTAPRGRRTGRAKLWEEDIWLIRRQPERSVKDLAAELGVAVETVRAVRRRKSWAWLPDQP